jgi:hypothetical protein
MALLTMRALLLAPLALAAACGLGPFDDQPGGRDNLPTRAAGPYAKPEIDFATPADEPYVLYEVTANYLDPTPLARDGGGFRVWFTRGDPDDGSAEIWYAELPDVHALPDVAPRGAVAPDAGWEESFVGEPAVVDLGGGHLVLYYRGGTLAPAIGRADSVDNGGSWQKHPANPILEGATSPAAALLAGGETALYFMSPDRPGIHAAIGDDGVAFNRLPDPIIEARPALEDAFDELAVADPFALVTDTLDEAEPVHVGLFFSGTRPGGEPGVLVDAIGYAGSYDGRAFTRFFGPDPVLEAGPPSEAGPGVISVAAGGVLFFHEPKQNRYRIGAAVHP